LALASLSVVPRGFGVNAVDLSDIEHEPRHLGGLHDGFGVRAALHRTKSALFDPVEARGDGDQPFAKAERAFAAKAGERVRRGSGSGRDGDHGAVG
jgi:hypothetical protein